MKKHPPHQGIPAGSQGEVWRLGALFGLLYFIQGIAEPGDGLIAQPLRSLMRSWGESAAGIATVGLVISVPWLLKPFYGLLSDFVPIFGSRRRSYLLICSVATASSLVFLFCFPPEKGAFGLFVLLLTVATVGVAFTDIVIDALMVEKGQPIGMTGRFQSIQWAAIYTATILTGVLGGYLSEQQWQRFSFLICGLITLPTIFMVWYCVDESERSSPSHGLRDGFKLLWDTARSPRVLAICAFLFLLNFNPFASTVLYLRMTEDLNWSEQFYGNCVSLNSVGCILGSLAYGCYCRRVPMRILIHVGIAACVISVAGYAWMHDKMSAVVISFLAGCAYMTANLLQLDMAARTCPPAAAGTTFALLMAVSNLAISSSAWVGGHLYDALESGVSPTARFNLLVGIGAACTAAAWLLVPRLRRDSGSAKAGNARN